jgi:hypothetical protein
MQIRILYGEILALSVAALFFTLGIPGFTEAAERLPPLLKGKWSDLPRQARQTAGQSHPEKSIGSFIKEGRLAVVQSPENIQEISFGITTHSESFSQLQQSVVELAGGGFAVVWEEGNFPSRDVRLQMLRPDGSFVFDQKGYLLCDSTDDESDVSVIGDTGLGAFVAFQKRLPSGGSKLIVQRFDAAGTPQWPGEGVAVAERINPQAFQSTPYLVVNSQGGVFACYQDYDFSYDIKIRCQSLSPSGDLLWSAYGKDAGGLSGWRVVPRGVSDNQGGLLIFWRNQRDAFHEPVDAMLMEGQHFATDGTKLWGTDGKTIRVTNLEESNEHTYKFYSVVPDGFGGAILAFNDWTGVSDRMLDVMAQRVSGEGNLLWGQGAVVTGADGHQQHEATIAAADGGAFVVVYESVSDTHSRLRIYRLGPDGNHLWPQSGYLLSNPVANALDFDVFGSLDEGILRLAWTHQKIPASYEFDVLMARYNTNGFRLDGPAGIPLTSAPDGQFLRGLAYSTKKRELLVIWDDRRSGTWENTDTMGAKMASPQKVKGIAMPWLIPLLLDK